MFVYEQHIVHMCMYYIYIYIHNIYTYIHIYAHAHTHKHMFSGEDIRISLIRALLQIWVQWIYLQNFTVISSSLQQCLITFSRAEVVAVCFPLAVFSENYFKRFNWFILHLSCKKLRFLLNVSVCLVALIVYLDYFWW